MAADAWQFYNGFREYVGDGTIDLDDDTFQVALYGAGYTPDVANHVDTGDLSDVCSGASSEQVTGKSWIRTGAVVDLTMGDVTIVAASALSPDPRYAVMWSVEPGGLLIAYTDLGTLAMSQGQRVRLDMSAAVS